MSMGIRLHSDLVLNFEQLGIKFQAILNEYQEQFEELSKQTLDNFDFEKRIELSIQNNIKVANATGDA